MSSLFLRGRCTHSLDILQRHQQSPRVVSQTPFVHLSRRTSTGGVTSLLRPMCHISGMAAPTCTKLGTEVELQRIDLGHFMFTSLLRPLRSVGVEFNLFYETFVKFRRFSPKWLCLFPMPSRFQNCFYFSSIPLESPARDENTSLIKP